MKPTDKQRREIKRYIKKWRPRLFLGEWYIVTQHMVNDENGWAATCDPDEVYFHATISVYPSFWKHRKLEREEIIVHELCHCLTVGSIKMSRDLLEGDLVTAKQIKENNEMLTQRITNIVFNDEWD